MCGIVGYISKDTKLYSAEKAHFMRYALALDTLRGEDSTGIMTLSGKFAVNVLKTTVPGDRFVHSRRYQQQMRHGWACVGHNRAATIGDITLDNAHPFSFGPITLVHNGTLFNKGSAIRTYDKNLDVDSMQIANALMHAEPEDAKKVIEELDGAFALVWYDERDKSINMCRNEDRPLHFTYNLAKDIMWFMSEGQHLDIINKSMYKSSAKGAAVYSLEKHKLYKWKKGSIVPEVTKFDPFVWVSYPSASQSSVSTGSSTTSSPAKSTKSGGTSSSALERAVDKWQQVTNSGKDIVPVKTPINGLKRPVPKPMQDLLDLEFGLRQDEFSEFIPEAMLPVGNNKVIVKGTIVLESWGDATYDCVLYTASKIQYNAYKTQSWLVRPIGIGHPFDDKNPSILAHLVHCAWDDYEERHPRPKVEASLEEEITGTSPSGDVYVLGPQGQEVLWSKLKPKLERGCIQCGMELKLGSLSNARYVNDGCDVICGDCHDDLVKLIGAQGGIY